MVKVVVVGTDQTERIQAAWSGLKEAEVVGIADSKAGLHELLKDKEVDLVDIDSTVESPEEWIKLAAEAGKHVICDASGQLDSEAIREAAKFCEQQGVQLFLQTDTLRFLPDHTKAHEHVRKGAIGKPGVIRMRRSAPAPVVAGGDGCIFRELGLAEFDWLRWTFGKVERVMARRVMHTDESGHPLEYALVILRHEDGTIAHVELSWAEKVERAAFELAGDAGMIVHDSADSQPIVWQSSKQQVQEQAASEAGRFAELAGVHRWQKNREHFVYSLSRKEPLGLSPEDVLEALKIVQATRQSAESGQPVQLIDGGDSR